MKTVLLTTDTTHHTYYAWKLNEFFPLQAVFLETQGIVPPFETQHPFERERDTYEREMLLKNCGDTIEGFAPTRSFGSMNGAACVAALQELAPEVVIVFGTGKLHLPIIRAASVACLNLHGGNPEFYRGLDSHLWTIYHNDFANLITTLHRVGPELDTGQIVLQAALPIDQETRLHTLRAVNTEICVKLTLLALHSLSTLGWLPTRQQVQKGRYYSFMPSVLKSECARRFERYVASL